MYLDVYYFSNRLNEFNQVNLALLPKDWELPTPLLRGRYQLAHPLPSCRAPAGSAPKGPSPGKVCWGPLWCSYLQERATSRKRRPQALVPTITVISDTQLLQKLDKLF